MSGSLAIAADLLVRSSLLVLLAAAAAALMRKGGASAAMRHLVWLSAIAALLLMPLLAAALPELPLPILPEVPAPVLMSALEAASYAPLAPSVEPEQWPLALGLLYAVIALLLLARLGAAWSKLARIGNAAEAADAEWDRLLAAAASDLGLKGRVTLRIARGPAMPMTWGTRAPRVLLPAEANGWSLEQKRLVLLHELAHVGRRDSLSQTAACLACALYWFHPGAWFAARQLRLEQEHAADDLALGAGARPRSYAQNLLALAGTLALPAPAMARATQLERRLLAIVAPGSRRTPGPAFAAIAAIVAAGATWLLATAVPVHALAESIPAASLQAPSRFPPEAASTAYAPAPARDGLAAEPRATPAIERAASRWTARSAPVAAPAGDYFDAADRQVEAGRSQALARQARTAALEDQARARGDDFLADGLAAQRQAYARQVEAYASQRQVLGQQREVIADQRRILARRPQALRERERAAREGRSVPALEAVPAVPAMPAIPAIPALPNLPTPPSEPRSPP